MVVVSHLFLFLEDKFRGRCDSHESHLPLFRTIYFPIAPYFKGFMAFYFVWVCFIQTNILATNSRNIRAVT